MFFYIPLEHVACFFVSQVACLRVFYKKIGSDLE
jgi:hypothetical protein